MKGKVLFSGVIAIILTLACGLAFAGGNKEGATAKKAYTVAFANVWEGNTWGVQSKAEFYAEVDRQKAAGRVGQVYYSNPNFNADKQVSDLEDLYTKNIDILIIQAVNPPAVSSIIEKFAAKGTIIIPCVSPLATDKYTATLLQDDKEFGAIGAQFLADKLGGKGNIIVLDGMDGITVAVGRWAGAKEVFDKYPDIKILGKTFADWDYAKGKTASENFLAAFPQIDGVWASGGDMTRGAIEAFVEAKRPLVPMFGEDSNGFLKLWKKYKGQGQVRRGRLLAAHLFLRRGPEARAGHRRRESEGRKGHPQGPGLPHAEDHRAGHDEDRPPRPAGFLLVQHAHGRRAHQEAVPGRMTIRRTLRSDPRHGARAERISPSAFPVSWPSMTSASGSRKGRCTPWPVRTGPASRPSSRSLPAAIARTKAGSSFMKKWWRSLIP